MGPDDPGEQSKVLVGGGSSPWPESRSDCLTYYYPRDVEDPDQLMEITRKHVRNYAA